MTAVLAPSILSANFARLGSDVKEVEAGGAALIHVDVMDGRFVPNLTVGPAVTRALREVTQLPLDCHLMIQDPARHIRAFVDAGADMISVHVEVDPNIHRTLQAIRELGAKAGVVLNPGTPLSSVDELLRDVDYVLLMSVNPGFSGQRMIPGVLDKAVRLRHRIDRDHLDCRIEIDGGVTRDNLLEVARTGVDMIVSGSAVFGSEDIRGTTREMVRALAELDDHGRTV